MVTHAVVLNPLNTTTMSTNSWVSTSDAEVTVDESSSSLYDYNDDYNYYFSTNATFDYASTPYIGEIKKVPLWEIVVKSYLYAMIIFFSLVGNTLIIVVVLRNKRMRTTTNFYIVNLAVADILVTVFCTWVHLVNNLNSDNWVLGSFFCKFNTFSQVLCLIASVLSLTLIAYDRFFGIVFALKAHMTNRKARGSIALIWICSLAIAAPLLRFRQLKERKWLDHTERWCDDDWPVVREFNPETNTTFQYMPARTIYFTFVSGVLYFFPMLAMAVAYSVIIRKLSLNTTPGERVSTGTTVQQKTKRKVIAMLVTIMSVFGICWLPYQVVILYSELREHREPLGEWYFTMQFLAGCFAYSNSALNPLIYAGFNENFKQAIILMKTELGSSYKMGTRRFSSRFSINWNNGVNLSSRRFGSLPAIADASTKYSRRASMDMMHYYKCGNSSPHIFNPRRSCGTAKAIMDSCRSMQSVHQTDVAQKRYLNHSQVNRNKPQRADKAKCETIDEEMRFVDVETDSSTNSSPMFIKAKSRKAMRNIGRYKTQELEKLTSEAIMDSCRSMPSVHQTDVDKKRYLNHSELNRNKTQRTDKAKCETIDEEMRFVDIETDSSTNSSPMFIKAKSRKAMRNIGRYKTHELEKLTGELHRYIAAKDKSKDFRPT